MDDTHDWPDPTKSGNFRCYLPFDEKKKKKKPKISTDSFLRY